MYPGVSTRVIIGMLNESQNLMNLAALFEESMSSAPARLSGWFATIPTTLPFNLAYPTITFGVQCLGDCDLICLDHHRFLLLVALEYCFVECKRVVF